MLCCGRDCDGGGGCRVVMVLCYVVVVMCRWSIWVGTK